MAGCDVIYYTFHYYYIIIPFFCCSFIVTPYNRRRDGVDNANYLRVCLCLWTVVVDINNFWVIGSIYFVYVFLQPRANAIIRYYYVFNL